MPSLSTMIRRRNNGSICTEEDADCFIPDRNNKRIIEKMKSICADCPVRELCRDIAYVYDEHTNLGGTTPKERQRFRETSDFFRLFTRAAKEGWLTRDALIEPAEYELAYRLAQQPTSKPALVTELVIEEIDVDFLESYVASF